VGGPVSLTGTGFGPKPVAEPVYFSTFDDAALGAPATDNSVGLECLNDPSLLPTVVQDRAHSGSQSLCMVYPASLTSSFPGIGKTLPAQSRDLYIGQWVYWERASGAGNAEFIFKWARAGGGAPYHGLPGFHHTQRPADDGTVGNPSGDTGFTTLSGTNVYDDTVDRGGDRDAWHWVEYKYRLSDPGSPNGMLQTLVDGTVNADLKNQVTRDASDTSFLAWALTVMDGNDQYNGPNGMGNAYRLYTDDTLIDVSLARVILTDSATYAASTLWAPQRTSGWSDTQITIPTPNYGGFAHGMKAYFHVFDADDAHVGAVAVTVP
jgi:hypothetical protein